MCYLYLRDHPILCVLMLALFIFVQSYSDELTISVYIRDNPILHLLSYALFIFVQRVDELLAEVDHARNIARNAVEKAATTLEEANNTLHTLLGMTFQ